jgi:hypothetical protein
VSRGAPRALLAAFAAARLGALWRLFFGAAQGVYYWSGDYPTRVLIAEQWSRRPFWGLSGTIWLPVSTYLTGTVLRFWPDTGASPAVFHMLLSTAALAFVYGIARELWDDEWTALAAAVWVGLDSWLTLLSMAGGASELDYQFFLLGGVWFWLRRLRTRRGSDLWASLALLSLAGGTRHEAWCFMLWPTWSLLREAAARRGSTRGRARSLAALVVLWLPAAAWLAAHAAEGLFPLVPGAGLLANLTHGIRSASGGRWGFFSRALWIYPLTLWRVGPAEALLGAAALVWALREPRRPVVREHARWLLGSFAALMLTPLASQFLPTFFEQVVLPYRLLLAPLWLHGARLALARLAAGGPRAAAAPRASRTAALAVLAAVLALGARSQARLRERLGAFIPDHRDTYELAVSLRRWRRSGAWSAERPYAVFETFPRVAREDGNRIWALNAVRCADTGVWPDRGYKVIDYAEDGSASFADATRGLLELREPALRAALRGQRVGLVIVHTPQAAAKLARGFETLDRIGVYTVLRARGAEVAAR